MLKLLSSLVAAFAVAVSPVFAQDGWQNPGMRRYSWEKRNNQFNKRAERGGFDVVFLGDSLTHFWEQAGKKTWDEKIAPLNAVSFGINGDTTLEVIYRLQNGNLGGAADPKVVVLMIGTNDNAKGRKEEGTAWAVGEIIKEIQSRRPKAKILLLAIFPRDELPDQPLRVKNAKTNALLAKLADNKTVFFKDIGPAFLEPDGKLSKEVSPDFLHLTEEGYRRWADAVVPEIKKLLESPPDMAEIVKKDRARGVVLPKTDHHYKRTQSYVEEPPEGDYLHAPAAAHEDFRDIKFAVRIHWGIYSIKEMNGESWGFLSLSNEKKQEYNNLYKTFNPEGFNAEEWMRFFKRSGLRCFAFTTKHHEGFSMFHTKTRVKQRADYLNAKNPIEACDVAYSIEETPFKRDIVKELCAAARRHGIKIDLYYSHPDWYDADFRPYNYHPLATPDLKRNPANYSNGIGNKKKLATPDRTPEETERLVKRHREQLRELLSNYGKIDMICLDQWMGADIWPQMRETVKMMRSLQPDVMLRCRGIGNYGDYYTPEGFVPGKKENTNMPWMVIYPLASSFSYDKDAKKYKGAGWIIKNLVDTVAKGGNFMVGIGPDGGGRFHPKAIEQLEETGKWLEVNGAGIYGTRARKVWKQGDGIRFTRTKDGKQVFALVLKWPGEELTLESVKPAPDGKVRLLGYREPLEWAPAKKGIRVRLPEKLQSPENRPCKHAWVFQIETEDKG
jgi:alpha-L-fucosidase